MTAAQELTDADAEVLRAMVNRKSGRRRIEKRLMSAAMLFVDDDTAMRGVTDLGIQTLAAHDAKKLRKVRSECIQECVAIANAEFRKRLAAGDASGADGAMAVVTSLNEKIVKEVFSS